MPKRVKKELERLSVNHDKARNAVFVFWIDGVTSGTLLLTPEQAIAIGDVGNMARVYEEEMKNA